MWPTITSLLENNMSTSFICPVFDTISLVARAFLVGSRAVSLQASNRSRRQRLSGCACQGVQRAGKSCRRRFGQELRHRASCGCPAAMLPAPFCRGSNGASRMRTPARNSCVENDASHHADEEKWCLCRLPKNHFHVLCKVRSFIGQAKT